MNIDMSTEPDQIRAQIAALLGDLPDPAAVLDVAGPAAPEGVEIADADIDLIAARLEEAHDLLVRALEAVEKG